MEKVYLGDSVYATIPGNGEVVLTTENGLPNDPSNSIVMELEVLRNFLTVLEAEGIMDQE